MTLEVAATLSAAADDLRLLAFLNDREATPELLAELRMAPVMTRFSIQPSDEEGRAAFGILDAALQSAECDGSPRQMDLLAADFAAIYLNHAFSISPTEGTFVEPEGLDRQEPMFEVRRWYTHYGVTVADWRRRPDDHLAHQLQFIAHLIDAPTPDAPKDAAAFMDHHVLRWIDHFASRVAQRCDTQFYAGVALTTAAILKTLRHQLVDLVGMPLVEMEPIEEEKRRRREKAQEAAAKFIPGVAPSW
jgi:TorA maturation chaperone TorD